MKITHADLLALLNDLSDRLDPLDLTGLNPHLPQIIRGITVSIHHARDQVTAQIDRGAD